MNRCTYCCAVPPPCLLGCRCGVSPWGTSWPGLRSLLWLSQWRGWCCGRAQGTTRHGSQSEDGLAACFRDSVGPHLLGKKREEQDFAYACTHIGEAKAKRPTDTTRQIAISLTAGCCVCMIGALNGAHQVTVGSFEPPSTLLFSLPLCPTSASCVFGTAL